MTPLTRRAFFKMLGGPAVDHISESKTLPKMEFEIGSVSRFPPGESCEIELAEGALRIVSCSRGIRAVFDAGEERSPVRLELGRNGKVFVRLNQKCEANLVLLHLTGEAALEE